MPKTPDFAASLANSELPDTWETDGFEQPADARRNQPPASILVRLDRKVRDDLKRLAIDEGTTVQGLMIEAINLVLARRNRLPIA